MKHNYNTCDLCGKIIEEHALHNAAVRDFLVRKFAKFFYKVDICENCNRKLGRIKNFVDMINEANVMEIDMFLKMDNVDEQYKFGYVDGLSALYDRIKQMI